MIGNVCIQFMCKFFSYICISNVGYKSHERLHKYCPLEVNDIDNDLYSCNVREKFVAQQED